MKSITYNRYGSNFQFVYWLLGFITFVSAISCKKIPEKRLSQYELQVDKEVKNDSTFLTVYNDLRCPLRIRLQEQSDDTNKEITFLLPPLVDTTLIFKDKDSEVSRYISSTMGNPKDSVTLNKMVWPFPINKSYRIIQGYNGKFSHQSEYSRYAIDFSTKVGDTINAAASGYVVGVIEDYKDGGNNRKWRNYANFITLFHPHMNIYTQYVHLNHMGSMVEVGDSVVAGQPIGFSGETGYVSGEHLHFNVLVADEKGMHSIPVVFQGNIEGSSLKKGTKVHNQ